MWIFYVVLIVLTIYVIYQFVTSKPIPEEWLNCFIGGLGAGKTYVAVMRLVASYMAKYTRYVWSIIRHPFKRNKWLPCPQAYSDIPVRLVGRKMTNVLTTEHIFMEKLLPQGSDVLFDELGQAADQYAYDVPAVKKNVQTFIRFLRQFVSGKFYSTEQSSDFIAKAIRGRFNTIIELRDLHRVLGILPFGKVYWRKILVTNDTMNVNTLGEDEWNHYFFWMGYRRHYDSKPYSEAYEQGFTHEAPEHWDYKNLKTRYIIDVRKPCRRDIYDSVSP